MRTFTILISLAILVLWLVGGCRKSDGAGTDSLPNPFNGEVEWNGFVFDTSRYQTPRAYIENWGENLDSLSADYDIKFTDGVFDDFLHDVKDYTILVYFDANSPSTEEFSEGTYTIEDTRERKPGNIIEAYIKIIKDAKLYKLQVTSGSVNFEKQDGYMLITYNVVVNEQTSIIGQYTGRLVIIPQTLNE